MKKFPILQTVLIILLVGVIAFGFFMTKKKPNIWEVNKTQSGAIEVLSDTDTLDTEQETLLYEKQKQALEEERNQYGYINEATDALNPELCKKIKDSSLQSQCNDNVYSAKANKEKNPAFCLQIQNNETKVRCQDGFVYDGALSKNDPSQCDNIKGNEDLSSACKKNIIFNQISAEGFTGSTDVCVKYLSGSDQQACIRTIEAKKDVTTLQTTVASKNVAGCESITDTNLRNICSDGIYYGKAMETKDTALCEKIVDTAKKAFCKTTLAAGNDDAIVQKAMAANNLSMCSQVNNTTKRGDCTNSIAFRLAIQNKDATMCGKILRSEMKTTCTDTVSKMTK